MDIRKSSSKIKWNNIYFTNCKRSLRGTTLCNSVCQGTGPLYVSHNTILDTIFSNASYTQWDSKYTQFPTIFLCLLYSTFAPPKNCIEIRRQNAFGIQLILLGRVYFNMHWRKTIILLLGDHELRQNERKKRNEDDEDENDEKIRIVKVFPGWRMNRTEINNTEHLYERKMKI